MKTKDYDLKERTALFGEAVIEFCLVVLSNPVTAPIINPLVRAGTSIGANYCEADDAESKKDFRHSRITRAVERSQRASPHFCRNRPHYRSQPSATQTANRISGISH
jgi:hypothetical protein